MELFREAGRLSRKKEYHLWYSFPKSEFEFTFLLNDSSEALHLLDFLHRKYKMIYNNDIFVRKNTSLNSENNNAIILIYIEDLFFAWL